MKLALFATVLGLEGWPLTVFIGWRMRGRRGEQPDTSRAHALYVVNHVQLVLVVVIVFVASFMARGFGAH